MGGAAASDGVELRTMVAADLPAAQALTGEMRWPHRLADWEQVFRPGGGVVALRDDDMVGAGLRGSWGAHHGTVGLVVVAPAAQGRRIGQRLMTALLAGLERRGDLLHATAEGCGPYVRLGLERAGEVRQHQGIALSAPLVALDAAWRQRPASVAHAEPRAHPDVCRRGMPRHALLADFHAGAGAVVVLDHGELPCGVGMLCRLGRGHVIAPVVAPDARDAMALVAHLAGANAGCFARFDTDATSGLAEWLESPGLQCVDAPITLRRGLTPGVRSHRRRHGLATQALA